MLLVGDIGGTKTDLALYDVNQALGTEDPQPEIQATFRSRDFSSLEGVIQQFLFNKSVLPLKAVFGVAGPVKAGASHITNLPWVISETMLKQTFNLTGVKLLNDLEAIAHAVPYLTEQDLEPLNGELIDRTLGKNKAVLAPGTGLGEAFLIYADGKHHVVASEGGHVDFAPKSLFEIELLKHLLGKFNHVSYERVCSGALGIPNIYDYLKNNRYAAEVTDVEVALQEALDPTPIIVQAALEEKSDLCVQTLSAFMSILGSEAGNLALKVMATGGVYLGGGIPPRILSKLKDGTFMAAFAKKGRFSDMLAHVPVYVILHKKPALLGAAYYGLTNM
ncbi:MAG TPA: glucokinase [Anaerolineae bacterium]|nr:glucokinase [Anaerolineae bacterium]